MLYGNCTFEGGNNITFTATSDAVKSLFGEADEVKNKDGIGSEI